MRKHLLECEPRVGDDPDRRLEVTANLVRINVDVNELGGRNAVGETGQPGAGRAIIKAGAERQNDVGIAASGVGHVGAVPSGYPQAERMAGIENALAEGGRRHRDRHRLRVRQERRLRIAELDPMPRHDYRTLGFRQEANRFGDGPRIARRTRPSRLWPMVFALGRLFIHGLHEDIQRHVNMHRSRPTVGHEGKRLAEGKRKHLGTRRLEAPLHVGTQDIDKVALEISAGLLEWAPIPLAGGHIAGDVEHRRGVGECRCDRDHDVCRSGTTGRIRRDGPLGDAEVGIGHECRNRFMMHG